MDKDSIIIGALNLTDKTLCFTSKHMAKLALWIYSGSPIVRKISYTYKTKNVKIEQWENRLKEYCASDRDIFNFRRLVNGGFSADHAFTMVVNSLSMENNL